MFGVDARTWFTSKNLYLFANVTTLELLVVISVDSKNILE